MIKVILLIDCASEFDRKLLRGMVRYSKENGSWLFYRIPSDLRIGEENIHQSAFENSWQVASLFRKPGLSPRAGGAGLRPTAEDH